MEAHLVGGGTCCQFAYDACVDAGACGILTCLANGPAADVAKELTWNVLDPRGMVAPLGGKEGKAVLWHDVTEVCRPDRAVIGRKRPQAPPPPPYRTLRRDQARCLCRGDGDDEGWLDVPRVFRDDKTGISQSFQGVSELVVGIALNVHPALGLEPLDELSQPGVTLALQIVVVSARKPDVTTREETRLGTTKKAEQICA